MTMGGVINYLEISREGRIAIVPHDGKRLIESNFFFLRPNQKNRDLTARCYSLWQKLYYLDIFLLPYLRAAPLMRIPDTSSCRSGYTRQNVQLDSPASPSSVECVIADEHTFEADEISVANALGF